MSLANSTQQLRNNNTYINHPNNNTQSRTMYAQPSSASMDLLRHQILAYRQFMAGQTQRGVPSAYFSSIKFVGMPQLQLRFEIDRVMAAAVRPRRYAVLLSCMVLIAITSWQLSKRMERALTITTISILVKERRMRRPTKQKT